MSLSESEIAYAKLGIAATMNRHDVFPDFKPEQIEIDQEKSQITFCFPAQLDVDEMHSKIQLGTAYWLIDLAKYGCMFMNKNYLGHHYYDAEDNLLDLSIGVVSGHEPKILKMPIQIRFNFESTLKAFINLAKDKGLEPPLTREQESFADDGLLSPDSPWVDLFSDDQEKGHSGPGL